VDNVKITQIYRDEEETLEALLLGGAKKR